MKYTKYKFTLCMKCNLRYMCLDGQKRCAKYVCKSAALVSSKTILKFLLTMDEIKGQVFFPDRPGSNTIMTT